MIYKNKKATLIMPKVISIGKIIVFTAAIYVLNCSLSVARGRPSCRLGSRFDLPPTPDISYIVLPSS